MKKLLATMALAGVALFAGQTASAQKGTDYVNAVGLRIDLGDELGTYTGISGKHFFNENSAGEGQLLFGNHRVLIGAEYQYHGKIQNAAGLKWFAGFGPAISVASSEWGGTDVWLRPTAGLDLKIKDVPLNFSADWRPAFIVTHGSHFTAARFGLGFRYTF